MAGRKSKLETPAKPRRVPVIKPPDPAPTAPPLEPTSPLSSGLPAFAGLIPSEDEVDAEFEHEQATEAPSGRMVEEVEFRSQRSQHSMRGSRGEHLRFKTETVSVLESGRLVPRMISVYKTRDSHEIGFLRRIAQNDREFYEHAARLVPE